MVRDYLVSVEEERRAAAFEVDPLRVPRGAQLGDRPPRLHPRPESGAPSEQIDRRDVLDELVLLGAPAEPRRILRAGVHDTGDAGADRLEGPRIPHLKLHPVATRAGVLAPGGGER